MLSFLLETVINAAGILSIGILICERKCGRVPLFLFHSKCFTHSSMYDLLILYKLMRNCCFVCAYLMLSILGTSYWGQFLCVFFVVVLSFCRCYWSLLLVRQSCIQKIIVDMKMMKYHFIATYNYELKCLSFILWINLLRLMFELKVTLCVHT